MYLRSKSSEQGENSWSYNNKNVAFRARQVYRIHNSDSYNSINVAEGLTSEGSDKYTG